MYKYKVLVTEEFKDKYTGKIYHVGEILDNLDEERVNEIKAVKNTLISTISKELIMLKSEIKEENTETKENTEPKKANSKKSKENTETKEETK